MAEMLRFFLYDVLTVLCFALLVAYSSCYGVGSCPCGLKVKAAGYAVNVEHFTCKIEVRSSTRFKSVLVYAVERYATAGYKFVFVVAATGNEVAVVR